MKKKLSEGEKNKRFFIWSIVLFIVVNFLIGDDIAVGIGILAIIVANGDTNGWV